VLITVFVLGFVFTWNDFIWNLLFAPSQDLWNAQVALTTFRGQWESNFSALLAAAVLIAIVPIVIFLLTQRYALAGLVGSATTHRKSR
jgi:ABC-type glycerol-3-phosphate transport system permease component